MTVTEQTLPGIPGQMDLFWKPAPAQEKVYEALGKITGSADTLAIQRVLADHGVLMDRNCIAKRLGELEDHGRVVRSGRNYDRDQNPTTWRQA